MLRMPKDPAYDARAVRAFLYFVREMGVMSERREVSALMAEDARREIRLQELRDNYENNAYDRSEDR